MTWEHPGWGSGGHVGGQDEVLSSGSPWSITVSNFGKNYPSYKNILFLHFIAISVL